MQTLVNRSKLAGSREHLLSPAAVARLLRPLRPRPSARGASTSPGVTSTKILRLLGVFTSPEKFQKYVERRFPRMVANSRWRSGDSQWMLSTPQWEFVASALNVDDEASAKGKE
ncbi:MAG TPA: hypothetical protein VFM35_08030 [Candidatus Binatia bacterium]|nr:hypothetical protein [Candidatus Binatia bacterium]